MLSINPILAVNYFTYRDNDVPMPTFPKRRKRLTGGEKAMGSPATPRSDGSRAASVKKMERFFRTSLKMKSETVRKRVRYLLSSWIRTYKLLRKLTCAGSTGTKASGRSQVSLRSQS
jgi:hypothetical protein